MPQMQSPYVGKPINVPDGQVDGFLAAGFALVEAVKPVESEKPVEKKSAPRRKSSK